MKGGDNEWQLIVEKKVATHGIGARIVPIGQHQTMKRQPHPMGNVQVLENLIMNAWEKKETELAANKVNGGGIF